MNSNADNKADRIIGLVMGRIAKRRLYRARAFAVFHLTLIAGAVASVVPVVRLMADRASQSGFSEYVSLAMSDGGYVMSSWSSFLLSLAESAPIASAAILAFVLTIFTYSLRGAARDFTAMRSLGIQAQL